KQLTPRSRAAVADLAARGTVVALASGRMYRHCMAPQVEALGLATPCICYNGAVILDPTNGQILSERPIAPELVTPVIDFAAARGLTLNLYRDDVLYIQRPTRWSELYVARTGAQPVFREDLYDWFRGSASTKMLLLDEPAEIEVLLREWQARVDGQLYVTISDPEYLEFMDPSATKGWALRRLCEHLGIDPAESAAFGDARNDLPLLEAAGYAVAMANARPELQAVADEIAPSNDEDGVAQVLERWLD
ncbi:MAG: HAD family phosphatase, partial [Armatimonadetes bacterium]|nr:HAD family phosphatase [Armatimonadota bacterium]